MTYKEYFAPDEWATLKLTVLWIFQAISQADGRTDMKEVEAMWAIRHNSSGFDNDLIREVIDTLDYDFAELLNRFNLDAWEIQSGLKRAANILDYLEPHDSREFKKSLVAIGTYIADASGNWITRMITRRESQIMKRIRELLRLSDNETLQYPSPQDILDDFLKVSAI